MRRALLLQAARDRWRPRPLLALLGVPGLRLTLEATAREAQEQALKAQLDPHVLYIALGGISELIREDADRAEAGPLPGRGQRRRGVPGPNPHHPFRGGGRGGLGLRPGPVHHPLSARPHP